MRDISDKIKTQREASAQATLKASPHLIEVIRNGTAPKGDPLIVAKIAAIQAAKNASQIIPYCHPLPVDYVGVDFELLEDAIKITVTIKVIYKTGVEMEALTAASVAALTIYDMLKMFDEAMEITGVKLLKKKGGKSDFKQTIGKQLNSAVIVISDSVSAGTKDDLSGQLIVEQLKTMNFPSENIQYITISDDLEGIVETFNQLLEDPDHAPDLIISTGGTGLSPRDNTPEAMEKIIEKDIPGMAEMMRNYGQERTPYAMLSRGRVGLKGQTLIINLPGSKNGVKESLEALFPAVLHGFKILRGGGHSSEQNQENKKELIKGHKTS